MANSVGASAGAPRTTRVMMEGVGARVVRGPDWKWGKQVRIILSIYFILTVVFNLIPSILF